MSERLYIQQKIQQCKQANPELKKLSDEQILSIMIEQGKITLSEAQKISIYTNSQDNLDDTGLTLHKQAKSQTINLKSGRRVVSKDGVVKYYAADGTELRKEYFEKQEGQIDVRQSGRYSVTKAGKTKYYAADGTELNESYFKRVENTDVKIKSTDGKTYNLNKTLEKRIGNVTKNLQKAEDSNGFIGSAWSGFKNLTGIGDSSDKVRKQQQKELKLLGQFNSNIQSRAKIFKELTGTEYTPENLEKFIKGEIKLKSEMALQGYKEGQDMAVDVGADIVAGFTSVGIYTAAVAAAPFTGGASIAVGVVAAGASAAAIKTGLKAADAAVGGREYTLQDMGHDAATGAFSGIIAPVTGGMGGAVGKTVATKLGIQAVKQVGKEVVQETAKGGVKQTVKTMLTNPAGYEYVGGNAVKRGLAFAAETATDGAIGGAVDNAFRTAYDGGSLEDIGNSALEGFAGGAIMSPLIGGGMKVAGKAGQKVFGKDNVNIDANGNIISQRSYSGADGVRQLSRAELKQKIREGSKLEHSGINEIHIPKVSLAAPRAFGEKTADYVHIIKNHNDELREISNRYLRDEIDEEGLISAFEIFLADKMDMPVYPEIKRLNDISGGRANGEFDTFDMSITVDDSDLGRISKLYGTLCHELHHFLQDKEMLCSFDSIEDFVYHRVNAYIAKDRIVNPQKYDTPQKYEAEFKKLSDAQIKSYKDAGWEDVLSYYPKNTDPSSDSYKRGRQLFDAYVNYDSGDLKKYYSNLSEIEAHEINVKSELEFEFSVLGSIDEKTYKMANDVYSLIKEYSNEYEPLLEVRARFESNSIDLIHLVLEAQEMGFSSPEQIVINIIDNN